MNDWQADVPGQQSTGSITHTHTHLGIAGMLHHLSQLADLQLQHAPSEHCIALYRVSSEQEAWTAKEDCLHDQQ